MAKSKTAQWLSRGGFVAGSVGLLSIFASAAPAFEAIHHLKEALDIYAYYVRDPLAESVGLEGTWPPLILDLGILWISTFAAVNAFIYQVDGMFVWGHVGHNYCYRTIQGTIAHLSCRLPKFLWAFLMTPIVCVVSIYSAIRTGRSLLTMAYMTVDPRAVAKYLVALFAVPTVLVASAAFFVRLASS